MFLTHEIQPVISNNFPKVSRDDGETELFEIQLAYYRMILICHFNITLDHALRTATNIHKEETGLEITHRQSRRHSALTLTDNNFADDIAFLCNTTQETKLLLQRVEQEVKLLHLHASHFTRVNGFQPLKRGILRSTDGFIYLESWIQKTENYANMRIGLVWLDASQSSTIWDSGLNREIKILWFRAAMESLLIYGA